MGRTLTAVFGLLVLAVVAAGLTETTLALGDRGGLSGLRLQSDRASDLPAPTPSPSVSPTPVPTPSPVPTPTHLPAATSGPTATASSYVRLRAGKSTSTAILGELNGGDVVELLPDSDSQWQQVRYQGVTGYVYKSYLVY